MVGIMTANHYTAAVRIEADGYGRTFPNSSLFVRIEAGWRGRKFAKNFNLSCCVEILVESRV